MSDDYRSIQPIHPAEITHHVNTAFQSNLIAWGGNALALLILIGGLTLPYRSPWKVPMMGFVLAAALSAKRSKNLAVLSERKVQDFSDVSDQQMQNYLYKAMEARQGLQPIVTAQATPVETIEHPVKRYGTVFNPPSFKELLPFDWNRIKELRNDYPHLCLLGGTGSGKTTLAEWLACELALPGEITIAVAPHWKQGDFASADLIVGAGRNYGVSADPYEVIEQRNGAVKEKGEPEVPFSRILDGSTCVTVCQFMRSLFNEMQARYSGDYMKGGSLTPVSIFLDEFPAWAGLPGVSKIIKQLIREARKVGIRLYILTQGFEVKTLGFEGEGSVRDSMTFIRLKTFAIEHAKKLLSTKDKTLIDGASEFSQWCDLLNKLQVMQFPVMVNDDYGEVPDLTEFSKALREQANYSYTMSNNTQSQPMSNDTQTPTPNPHFESFERGGISQKFASENQTSNIPVPLLRQQIMEILERYMINPTDCTEEERQIILRLFEDDIKVQKQHATWERIKSNRSDTTTPNVVSNGDTQQPQNPSNLGVVRPVDRTADQTTTTQHTTPHTTTTQTLATPVKSTVSADNVVDVDLFVQFKENLKKYRKTPDQEISQHNTTAQQPTEILEQPTENVDTILGMLSELKTVKRNTRLENIKTLSDVSLSVFRYCQKQDKFYKPRDVVQGCRHLNLKSEAVKKIFKELADKDLGIVDESQGKIAFKALSTTF